MKITIILLFLIVNLSSGQSVTINPQAGATGIIAANSTQSGVLVSRMTTTQRTNILSPSTGLLVFDTTTNTFWYYNSSSWKEINSTVVGGQWTLTGANLQSSNTGNVGIGSNPTKAKFEVNSSNTTQAIFGSGGEGISFQKNFPTIGFNQYRDDANVQRYLANGFAMGNYLSPSNGSMVWAVMPSGVAGNPTISETPLMTLNSFGNLGIGTLTPQAKLHVEGFSKLGDLSPNFKLKSLTGTIPCLTNNCTDNIPHGLDATKILDVTIVIADGTTFVEPNDCTSFHSGYCYYTSFDATNIIIRHPSSGTANTLGKPYKILITFSE